MPDPPPHKLAIQPLVPLDFKRPKPTFGHGPLPPVQTDRPLRVLLVLSGGGADYVKHCGAIEEIEAQGWVQIVGIAGTSAGALAASLTSARRHPDEPLWDIVRRTLPGEKVDLPKQVPRPDGWGMYEDGPLVRTLRAHLVERFDQARIPLAVCTTQISPIRQQIVSSWAKPDYCVASAVRASISIPFAFDHTHLCRWERGRRRVVATKICDGGLSSNLPVDDINWPSWLQWDQVWAVDIRPASKGSVSFTTPWAYVGCVIGAVVGLNEVEDVDDARRRWGNRLKILRLPADESDSFEISTERAKRMWGVGRRIARRWLRERRNELREES